MVTTGVGSNRPQPTARSRARLSKKVRNNLKAYLFVLPWLISLVAFVAFPTLASFYWSLTKYDILNPPRWTGLSNFRVMFSEDPLYWKSVGNTLYYSFFSVILGQMTSLFLAVLLNRAGTTFRKLPESEREGLTEKKAIALMLAQPSMIKRPVLDIDGRLLVGFKPDEYAKVLR